MTDEKSYKKGVFGLVRNTERQGAINSLQSATQEFVSAVPERIVWKDFIPKATYLG